MEKAVRRQKKGVCGMKKFVKVCLILSASCFIIGIALCVAGGVMGVSKDDVFDMAVSGEFSFGGSVMRQVAGGTHSYDQEFEGIRSLDISLDYGSLDIRESSDDMIRAEAKNVNKTFHCIKTGDTLEINDEVGRWWKRFSNGYEGGKIVLYIPKDSEFENISISVGAGRLNAGDLKGREMSLDLGAGKFNGGWLSVKEDLEISIGAGSCNIGRFETRSFAADCGAGSLTAEGSFEQSAEMNCGVGKHELTLDGKEQDYNYEIDEALGQVVIGGQHFSGLDNDKSIDNKADKDLEISNGMGQTTIMFKK